MEFEIFHYEIRHKIIGAKEGFLLRGQTWSEVAPFPGRSRETLKQALDQLKAVQQGYQGPLYPSVAFGLFGLPAKKISRAPVCLFLMGSAQEISTCAEQNFGCTTAKVKIGPLDLSTAVSLVKTLKQKFRLRIDVGESWPQEKILAFCSHFQPDDFDFLEDPGFDVTPYPMASDHAHLGSTLVWKPMIRGIPDPKNHLILSSSFESGVGIHQIASLAEMLEIPSHPLGIGTFMNVQEDLLEEPLTIRDGQIHFPAEFRIKQERLTRC